MQTKFEKLRKPMQTLVQKRCFTSQPSQSDWDLLAKSFPEKYGFKCKKDVKEINWLTLAALML